MHKLTMLFGVLMCLLPLNCTPQNSLIDQTHMIQSVTLDARNKPSEAMLPTLKELGVTHVTLVQFGFQRSIEDPEIRMNPDAGWYSESDQGARELSQQADSLGLHIILKPHLWLGGYSHQGQSRNEIGYADEDMWNKWETDYTVFLMHYAHLAEEIGAEILVIGTELARSAHERPQFWQDLIVQIRSVYQGQLTYAANWWEEYEEIGFWESLDFIGVQAYFELSDQPNPTDAMLSEGWSIHKEALSSLSERLNRPVLFTELGYRNVDDAAAKPWRWPSHDEIGTAMPNNQIQAQLYNIFFHEVWNEPWLHGAILWKWHGDRERRRTAELGFTPQGKPAEEVIRQWFTSSQ